MSSLTTLSVSLLATAKVASQLSGASRGRLTYLPRVQHLAYNAMAHLIAQYLGNEEENTLAELAEMLRNGDLYRVGKFRTIHMRELGLTTTTRAAMGRKPCLVDGNVT